MQRFNRFKIIAVLLVFLGLSAAYGQKPDIFVSGKIEPGEVMVFLKDNNYIINKSLTVGGTLIIEPGTTVYFNPNSSLIDSTGGRIIADGLASATYAANPELPSGTDLDPEAIAGSLANPEDLGNGIRAYANYADLNYFLHGNGNNRGAVNPVVDFSGTAAEQTINGTKMNDIFNVVLDTVDRELKNYQYQANSTNFEAIAANRDVVISYEQALMFYSSRMNEDPSTDVNLLTNPWRRLGDKDPSVNPERIKFIGQPANNFSREWGHIVILPGARAAFFRNVDFESFKKDTTVDNEPTYDDNQGSYAWAAANSNPDWDKINNDIRVASNGSGGVITSFSARTWVLGCNFTNNQARFNGGAVQFLEAPEGLPSLYADDATLKATLGTYDPSKNPAVTNPDGSESDINTAAFAGIPRIDLIDSQEGEPLSDLQRAAFDDGRISLYLARFRNNSFQNNKVKLANTVLKEELGVTRVTDDDVADYVADRDYGNHTHGGAIYLAGREGNENRKIEVGLGINNGINIESNGNPGFQPDEYVEFDIEDTFVAISNTAENLQTDDDSEGAKGGAVYVGDYTSLIVAGQFTSNQAKADYFLNINSGLSAANYSQGGAIFTKNTDTRLQVVGGPARDAIVNRDGDLAANATLFSSNKAGSGGAIFCDDNAGRMTSPYIGGTDDLISTRDKGFNILFENNEAWAYGGAIYTRRNIRINGAGGVENNQLLGYGGKFPVRFWGNTSGLAGGAIFCTIPDGLEKASQRNIVMRRASFRRNETGYVQDDLDDNAPYDIRYDVRGGGAIYTYNGDVNVVQGSEFIDNAVFNGNGGAIAQIISSSRSSYTDPDDTENKLFVSDLDVVNYDGFGVGSSYVSTNDPFVWDAAVNYPADARMLTRFIGNKSVAETDVLADESGSGTTQRTDNNRQHLGTTLNENGVGLGGSIFILDVKAQSQVGRNDSIHFNRVRLQNNEAYSGAVAYSDNYDLKLVFNRSLITGNTANSSIGNAQNLITGPVKRDANGDIENNFASHDLVGAIIYGEVQGPLPSNMYSEAANSIYDNNARFLIRLPDAPDTKGALAGTTGLGDSGTDTLRGNYWGKTQANIDLDINNDFGFISATPETFFIAGPKELGETPTTLLPFRNSWTAGDPEIEQGPFESKINYTYEPIPLRNDGDENTPAANTVPEKYLFSGQIYDIYDKGTDIKAADYSKRRMSPIEDFAVGIPTSLRTYDDASLPSNGKYVKRYTRDPFCTETDNDTYNELFDVLFKEYSPNTNGDYYHPIGQPIYLEAMANYDGLIERNNDDPNTTNETVFFVINDNTGDYIRVNMKQVSEEAPNRETFRARVELVPDQTNRGNPSLRRTAEGLFNIGVGRELLLKMYQDPYTEDGATLPGRKYDNPGTLFGGVSDIFSNRRDVDGDGFDEFGTPALPDDNNGRATFFAGERYGALPVSVGDVIRVISRTELWQNNVDPAIDGGLTFEITEGIEQPQFTGDIVQLRDVPQFEVRPTEENVGVPDDGDLETIEIEEFRNTVFVREDRSYPASNNAYGADARDSILSITAIDSNNYYDPRALINESSGSFTYLTYGWELPVGSGLRNWLVVDTTYAADVDAEKDGAIGYQRFEGTPTNPYVVPGGEQVTVFALSYPPHWRTIDSLKATFGWDSDNETLAKLIETYPEYYHAQSYEADQARFLQQDTVDMASDGSYRAEYEFTIFVVDSLPKFINFAQGANPDFGVNANSLGNSGTITRNDQNGDAIDTLAVYVPSERACPSSTDGRLVANLTDKLRFQLDINTNDELEDMWAQKVHNWDFRYGRSAYGFKGIHNSGGDISDMDTSYYVDEDDNVINVISQNKPFWMSDQFIYAYGSETMTDGTLNDFTLNGQLNVRIDADEAYEILRKSRGFNGDLNLDTSMTVVATDGHGGRADLKFDIIINTPPVITTEELPFAKEDFRYNPQLVDTTKKINVFDANYDQTHTFEIIRGQYDNGIPKDPCFPEAGNWELGTDYENTTAEWLEINPTSGLLFGTPGVEDAPRFNDLVSILVTDSEGLTTVKQFELRVDSTQHTPDITVLPPTDCYDVGESYEETFSVYDEDLGRTEDGYFELLDLEVIEPANGFRVEPSRLQGPGDVEQDVVIISNSLPGDDRDPVDGRLEIVIRVTDLDGNEVIKSYKINLSDPVLFTSDITITNDLGATETLTWGTALTDVTTGDGKDKPAGTAEEDLDLGTLDNNYCEYELPPLPPIDVFDARWTLPKNEGIIRNIYPAGITFDVETLIYKINIQPGGENGNVSSRYPLTITWDKDQIPAQDDNTANPDGSSWWLMDGYSNGEYFRINMNTGEVANSLETFIPEVNGTSTAQLTITNSTINSLIIVSDIYTNVENNITPTNAEFVSVNPNPVREGSNVAFNMAKDGMVTIELIDIYGNVVSTLAHNQLFAAGIQNITVSNRNETGAEISSGAYNLRLTTKDATSTMPIRIVK